MFEDTSDTDYREVLGAIESASQQHRAAKRFDMAGFRPNDHYLIQMQHHGVLPKDLPPTEPIDPYATDRAYWRSFWYHPGGGSGE